MCYDPGMDKRDPAHKRRLRTEPKNREIADDGGVDVTLIRWMLSLSPAERLHVLEGNVASILRLRGGRSR